MKLFESLVHDQARFVGTLLTVRPIKANPSKDGDAKPWVYHLIPVPEKKSGTNDVKIARLPNANEIRPFRLSAFIDAEETMTLNAYTHRTWHTAFLLIIFAGLFLHPVPAFALEAEGDILPDFAEFSRAVQNQEANTLRGVYVPGVLALPVVQQPAGNAGYVSNNTGEVTQFGMAAQFGNVGLLAHNHLSGSLFSQLAVGQEVRLVYGNRAVEYFMITQILQFQALAPTNPYGSFRDLNTDEQLNVEQVFNKVYRGDRHVTFQTCIASLESPSWGRLFVVAIPKQQVMRTDRSAAQLMK